MLLIDGVAIFDVDVARQDGYKKELEELELRSRLAFPIDCAIWPFEVCCWDCQDSMAQAEAVWLPGVVDSCLDVNSFVSGHLSLHDYRKFLSQPDGIDLPVELRGRTLKRKAATSNLNQARIRQDSSFSPSSPLSSAPSSPPPLSFSQSIITLQSENESQDPATPLGRLFPRPPSQTKQLNAFKDRLRSSHKRASSDSALLGADQSPKTVVHDGISFDIINPRESLDASKILSSHRSSGTSRETIMTSSTPRPSTARSARDLLESLPDAHLSASTSSKFPSPSPGLLESDNPFSALPNLVDLPTWSPSRTPTPFETPSPRTKKSSSKLLTQKISQLFGSSGETKEKLRKLFSPKSKLSELESQEPVDYTGPEAFMTDGFELAPLDQQSIDSDHIYRTDQEQPEAHAAQGQVEMSTAVGEGSQYGQAAGLSVGRFSFDSYYDASSQDHPDESQVQEPGSEDVAETVPHDITSAGDEGSDTITVPQRRPIPLDSEYRDNRFHTIESALADESDSITYLDIIEFLRYPSDPDLSQDVENQNHEDRVEEAPRTSFVADQNPSELSRPPPFPDIFSIETQPMERIWRVRESTRSSIRPYLPAVEAFMARSRVSGVYTVQSDIEGGEATRHEQEREDVVDESESNYETVTEGSLQAPESFVPFAGGNAPSGTGEHATEQQQEHDSANEEYTLGNRLERCITGSSLANVTSRGSARPATPTPVPQRPSCTPRRTHNLLLTHRDSFLSHRMRFGNPRDPVFRPLPDPTLLTCDDMSLTPRFYGSDPSYPWGEPAISRVPSSSRVKPTKQRIRLPLCCCC